MEDHADNILETAEIVEEIQDLANRARRKCILYHAWLSSPNCKLTPNYGMNSRAMRRHAAHARGSLQKFLDVEDFRDAAGDELADEAESILSNEHQER